MIRPEPLRSVRNWWGEFPTNFPGILKDDAPILPGNKCYTNCAPGGFISRGDILFSDIRCCGRVLSIVMRLLLTVFSSSAKCESRMMIFYPQLIARFQKRSKCRGNGWDWRYYHISFIFHISKTINMNWKWLLTISKAININWKTDVESVVIQRLRIY